MDAKGSGLGCSIARSESWHSTSACWRRPRTNRCRCSSGCAHHREQQPRRNVRDPRRRFKELLLAGRGVARRCAQYKRRSTSARAGWWRDSTAAQPNDPAAAGHARRRHAHPAELDRRAAQWAERIFRPRSGHCHADRTRPGAPVPAHLNKSLNFVVEPRGRCVRPPRRNRDRPGAARAAAHPERAAGGPACRTA